ncbi:MAG: cytochrome c oxidase accessory protein CcoG [Bdellovibrionales bacterium]
MTELPAERPASLDPEGHRISLHPARVKGEWNTRRVYFQTFLVLTLLILPWIKINGYPAVLIDLPHRRFALFGLTFWAHDTPLLFLVMGTFAFSAALLTALFGRVWCGWACPQTVFIERVFRQVEFLIEGHHLEQKALDASAWGLRKIKLKTLKWSLFTAISLIITHSLLAYFVGVDQLYEMMQASPQQAWPVFLIMAFTTSILLFNFGWFREQFCIIMCPYGKIQSLLTDEDTLSVAYDNIRGEPRGEGGDCVACFKCVSVCPTGIDIRRGSQQLECINCTACIDVCNEVMKKVKKPQGLIRYASEVEILKGVRKSIPSNFKKMRIFLYTCLLLFCVSGLVWTISNRRDLRIVALRASESPYQLVHDDHGNEKIINHFKIDLQNQNFETFEMKLLKSDNEEFEFVTPQSTFDLRGGQRHVLDVFVKFDPKVNRHNVQIAFVGTSDNGTIKESVELGLISPQGAE